MRIRGVTLFGVSDGVVHASKLTYEVELEKKG